MTGDGGVTADVEVTGKGGVVADVEVTAEGVAAEVRGVADNKCVAPVSPDVRGVTPDEALHLLKLQLLID